MDNQLFRDIQTDLDLNGPILSFTTQPVDVTSNVGQTATFTAVATVSFPGDSSPSNTGTIAYQWYGPGGILTEGTKYVGTKTTTLQITNVTSPTDVGNYYVVVDYVPSSETGNALNEPLRSDNGNLIAPPLIEIIAQPTPITTIPSTDNNFNINAQLTNNETDIGYQWQLDGENVSDGTVTKSTVELIPGTTQRRVRWGASNGNSQTIGIPIGAKEVLFEIAGAAGGNGGGNFNNPGGPNRVGGRGGYGMTGWFRLGDNFYHSGIPSRGLGNPIQVEVRSGLRGNDGVVGSTVGALGGDSSAGPGDGGMGGAHGIGFGGVGANGIAGSSGDAGGGGGGGASACVIINGTVAAIAGGGGGGGGAFNNTNQGPNETGTGHNGLDAGPVRTTSGPHNFEPSVLNWTEGQIVIRGGSAGSSGHSGQGIDTPGGGGGGAGDPGGFGGWHGHRPNGSPGGGQGGSMYNSNLVTYRSGSYNAGDGWAAVSYIIDEGETLIPTNVTRTTTISGSATNQLTLNTDGPGIGYTVRCNVNSSIASNSPLVSDEVPYHVESTIDSADIIVEGIGLNNTLANVSRSDLSNGEITLDSIGTGFVGPAPTIQLYSLHAPDSDVNVEMDLYGGGSSDGSTGEGGFARIRFTMERNVEYVIAGLTDNVNTPFLYRKASLMACVGEGGKSGPTGSIGGDGGGINIAGGDVSDGAGGSGGPLVSPLTLEGKFGSAFIAPFLYPGDRQAGDGTGGVTISCTKGVYFAQEGLSPCQDITDPTLSHFRLSDSREVSNSALINRGYKSGYNIIQTAGGGRGGFRGGNGATGGDGGQGPNRAGGGGSGYGDGSFTIVTTTQGGSTESAKVVIRVVT